MTMNDYQEIDLNNPAGYYWGNGFEDKDPADIDFGEVVRDLSGQVFDIDCVEDFA